MSYSLTIFKNIYDTKTHRRMEFETFKRFEIMLRNMSKVKLKTKKDGSLISPAKYQPGTTRKNVNVEKWDNWCVVDVDDHDMIDDLENTLFERYGHFNYICYSTASSTYKLPKFRLIFPLTEPVYQEKIKHFWHALAVELGDIVDIQTKDFSRMFYIPGNYDSAEYQFFFVNHSGSDMDPSELMKKVEPPKQLTGNSFFDSLPEEVQNEIIQHKKAKLDNRNVRWNSFRNCPYWSKKHAAEYINITGSGWYYKLYIIMCAIASNAIKDKYPINAQEIVSLIKEFDAETGGWYQDRPLMVEANRALEYVYRNTLNT